MPLTDARRHELVQQVLEGPLAQALTQQALEHNVVALEREGFVRLQPLGPLVRSCPIGLERVQGLAVTDPATGQALLVQVVFTLTTRRRRSGVSYVSLSVFAFDTEADVELTQKRSALYRHDQFQGDRVTSPPDDEAGYLALLEQRARAPLSGAIDFDTQPGLFARELLRQLTP